MVADIVADADVVADAVADAARPAGSDAPEDIETDNGGCARPKAGVEVAAGSITATPGVMVP